MPLSDLDHDRLGQAITLAEGSFGLTEPNPRVGCILGDEAGAVFGQGATQQAGGAHAEVMALRAAQNAGARVQGATAWVTLEPCANQGRTGPCCEALVAAGIGRVVIGTLDPFPAVNGTGAMRLRAAGVTVVLAEGDVAAACRAINVGFFSRVERGRPWVRMKVASSLDGKTALPDGSSQWITGEAARRDGHAWRRRASAVLTGIGTVLADDPRLDVRLVPTPSQPLRVILDTRWRTPPSARMLKPPGKVVVFGAAEEGPACQALRAQGAELVRAAGAQGQVDLHAVMAWLGSHDINELHVEAGARLNGALLMAGLVDEVLLYLAPTFIGDGRPMAELGRVEQLGQAWPLQLLDIRQLGVDLCLRLLTLGRQSERA